MSSLPPLRQAKGHAPFAADPVMQALWARYGADLKPLTPAPDPFLRLLRSVVGQQLSLKAAHTIWARVEAWAAQQARLVEGGAEAGLLTARVILEVVRKRLQVANYVHAPYR